MSGPAKSGRFLLLHLSIHAEATGPKLVQRRSIFGFTLRTLRKVMMHCKCPYGPILRALRKVMKLCNAPMTSRLRTLRKNCRTFPRNQPALRQGSGPQAADPVTAKLDSCKLCFGPAPRRTRATGVPHLQSQVRWEIRADFRIPIPFWLAANLSATLMAE